MARSLLKTEAVIVLHLGQEGLWIVEVKHELSGENCRDLNKPTELR